MGSQLTTNAFGVRVCTLTPPTLTPWGQSTRCQSWTYSDPSYSDPTDSDPTDSEPTDSHPSGEVSGRGAVVDGEGVEAGELSWQAGVEAREVLAIGGGPDRL